LSHTLSSRSPLVLFGRLTLPPPRGGSASVVSPQSCQFHGFLQGLCYSLCCGLSKDHLLYFLCDRADDSSIHRGTYHILESTWSLSFKYQRMMNKIFFFYSPSSSDRLRFVAVLVLCCIHLSIGRPQDPFLALFGVWPPSEPFSTVSTFK